MPTECVRVKTVRFWLGWMANGGREFRLKNGLEGKDLDLDMVNLSCSQGIEVECPICRWYYSEEKCKLEIETGSHLHTGNT